MTRLIFAFMQTYTGNECVSLLLARSLRIFGGKLANHLLWLMVPQKPESISESMLRALEELGVQFSRFEVPEEALQFPFGGKVYAAAAAETLASNNEDILVWMDSDTVFTGEPSEVVLGENVSLGYRPVMLKNISSLYDEPVNDFWDFIYKGCGTVEEDISLMLTTIDKVRIRPQFNAGILCVRPWAGLLRAWRNNFERLYQQPELVTFYQEHVLYRIFVHQAILSATLLARLKKEDMQDLGQRFNYPVFLETNTDIVRNAVTLRYDDFKFFEESGWENKIDLDVQVKAWLQTQVGG